MIGSADLLQLVDLLYDGAVGGTPWREVIATIISALGGDRGGLFIQDSGNFALCELTLVGIEPALERSYAPLASSPDMMPLYASVARSLPASGVVDDVFDSGYPELRRTGLYQDWLRPARMDHYLQAHMAPWPSAHGRMAVARPAQAGGFDGDAMDALTALQPHLLRAVQVRSRLAAAETVRHQALEALDRIGEGVLLVDAAARVAHESRAATAILAAADGLRLDHGMVGCETGAATGQLRRLIGAAATIPGGGGRLMVPRRSGRRPLSLLVAPLRGEHRWLPVPSAAVIVLINDPERVAPIDGEHLRELYGLTAAEARTSLALLDSDRLQDIADRFGVSLSAVRIHLQRAFEKTGTHRQAELVRLLLAHRLPGLIAQAGVMVLTGLAVSLAAA
jgi:DNA-binding CsgD family transcriptional regulator